MVTYAVERIDDDVLTGQTPLDGMDLMSPFVWAEGERYRIMVRGVPDPLGPTDPTGVIVAGASHNGLTFAMDRTLAITPGPNPSDAGGCEDPTVLVTQAGYLVYYTGVDAGRTQGAMILAEGADLTSLVKRELVLKAPPGEGNIKEATLAQTGQGDWRLFYEYAANDASRIGMAGGPGPEGPWTVLPDPFGIRDDSWDNWHLSTGPIVGAPGHDPVMFYNGATHDARWRIGWISFDADFTRVTGRGLEPMLVPPPATDRSAADIAFAASTVMQDDGIALYYSLEDRMLKRAIVRRYGSGRGGDCADPSKRMGEGRRRNEIYRLFKHVEALRGAAAYKMALLVGSTIAHSPVRPRANFQNHDDEVVTVIYDLASASSLRQWFWELRYLESTTTMTKIISKMRT